MNELQQALARADAYPGRVEEVTHRETHISDLFFAGNRVYKVKKPVDLGFLDFTTRERRRHFCEEEVRLNRRLAPDTYLGVVPIRRAAGGRLRIGGEGEIVDYAVEMERLPAAHMLERLLERGEIDNAQMNRLVARLVDFHRRAATGPGVDEHGSLETVTRNTQENFDQTRPFAGEGARAPALSAELHRFLEENNRRFLDERRELFCARVAGARIRDGHGDLHAGNICYLDQRIVIYDCIEFAERLRCGDVACDLAFLAMDLDFRGYRGFSRYFVKRYGEEADDPGLLELIDFYKTYRAVVRAKVACLRSGSEADPDARERALEEAMRYFHLAASYLLPPVLILTCGLPASGKSWAARAVARPFEAVLGRSDVRRKLLAQVPLGRHRNDAWGEGIYTPELNERTYGSLLEEANHALEQRRPVIIDATFSDRERRARFLELARRHAALALVLHVTAPEATIHQRLAARAKNDHEVSDADLAIYLRAKESFEPPDELPALQVLAAESGSESAEELTGRVIDRLVALAAAPP